MEKRLKNHSFGQKIFHMSKVEDLLKAFQDNLGNWTCAYCGSDSGQPAAIFREIKKQGYVFEEISPNRWAFDRFCSICQANRTHYKLLKAKPEFSVKERIVIDSITRARLLQLFGNRDAFTGASITSTPEIDHKIPWTRLNNDIDARTMTDEELKEHFQLLTREHNLLKDRMCSRCKETSIRPPFLEISYWYQGNQQYMDTCIGCGWYDGVKWRKSVNETLI